jgi:NhaP-type Na+/H+ and K+/H+ antiporter
VSDWLKRSPTWQFVLLCDAVMVMAVLIGMSAGQWLWHHHLDPSALLGAAVGSALGATVIAIGYRQSQKYSTKARRLSAAGQTDPLPTNQAP